MNRLVLWLLAQRRLGRRPSRSLVGLRIRGRRTGRVSTFPVQYAADGSELVVMPARHGSKTWWRNLVERSEIEVLQTASWGPAAAWVVQPAEVGYAPTRAAYLVRWPHARLDMDQPFVRIAPSRRPT